MFSPLNDPQVEHWFQRLNAPLKRLPADERTQIHQEVRQHLEALAAANEELGSSPPEALELALQQFGDPGKIGKQMAQEWHQSRTGFRAETTAILFGVGLQALMWVTLWLLPLLGVPMLADYFVYLGVTQIVLYFVLGRRYSLQAIRSAFYTDILCSVWYLLGNILVGILHTAIPQLLIVAFHPTFLLIILMPSFLHLGIAYLASVTKRGWYRPTWEDFKLTWPKRRRIAG